MFAITKIALAAAIVLGTAVAASAATKPQAAPSTAAAAVYTKIPGYNGAGAVVAIPDPDHSGQSQLSGDENPLRH